VSAIHAGEPGTALTILGGSVEYDALLVPQAETAWVYPSADRNPALVYLARLAEGSRRTMRQALNVIADILSSGELAAEAFPWAILRYEHTAAVRSRLAGTYAPATANKMMAALRGVIESAWRLGYVDADAFRRATDLLPVRGSTIPAGRDLTPGEVRALFAVCAADPRPAGARDAAALAVCYGALLRRSEAVAVDLADLSSEAGSITVRSGKGAKGRIAYASRGSWAAIEAWLLIRGREPGPLFLPISKGGRVAFRRMTDQALYNIVVKRCEQAGLEPISPHDFRRTCIGDLLDAGADIGTVADLAGHANVRTTQRYDRRRERRKRGAADLVHVPYVQAHSRDA
jgi:integrase